MRITRIFLIFLLMKVQVVLPTDVLLSCELIKSKIKGFLKYTPILMIRKPTVTYGTKYDSIFKFNAAPFLQFFRYFCRMLYFLS